MASGGPTPNYALRNDMECIEACKLVAATREAAHVRLLIYQYIACDPMVALCNYKYIPLSPPLFLALPLSLLTYAFVGSSPAAPSHNLGCPECVSGSTTLHLTKFNASCNAKRIQRCSGPEPGSQCTETNLIRFTSMYNMFISDDIVWISLILLLFLMRIGGEFPVKTKQSINMLISITGWPYNNHS